MPDTSSPAFKWMAGIAIVLGATLVITTPDETAFRGHLPSEAGIIIRHIPSDRLGSLGCQPITPACRQAILASLRFEKRRFVAFSHYSVQSSLVPVSDPRGVVMTCLGVLGTFFCQDTLSKKS